MSKFKIGDRVKCISVIDENYNVKNAVGTIINITETNGNLVQFDKFINGHSNNDNGTVIGKYGHCWWCKEYDLELYERIIKQYGIVKFCESIARK